MNPALHTKWEEGPSGMDAYSWRRIIGFRNYGKVTDDLCKSIAAMAKRLCSIEIEMKVVDGKTTSSIESYTACRLIPLENKVDGVRPIGIGGVLRRIIGKEVCIQRRCYAKCWIFAKLCAGQSTGCEAAIHAMSKIFE